MLSSSKHESSIPFVINVPLFRIPVPAQKPAEVKCKELLLLSSTCSRCSAVCWVVTPSDLVRPADFLWGLFRKRSWLSETARLNYEAVGDMADA